MIEKEWMDKSKVEKKREQRNQETVSNYNSRDEIHHPQSMQMISLCIFTSQHLDQTPLYVQRWATTHALMGS